MMFDTMSSKPVRNKKAAQAIFAEVMKLKYFKTRRPLFED